MVETITKEPLSAGIEKLIALASEVSNERHNRKQQEEAPAVAAAEADANPTDHERALPCPR